MAYIDFWRRWRDFTGKTSRFDFWVAMIVYAFSYPLLGFLFYLILSYFFHVPGDKAIEYCDKFSSWYQLICTVPLLSMWIRRLRDVGYNAENMWKLLIPGVAVFSLYLPSYHENDNET